LKAGNSRAKWGQSPHNFAPSYAFDIAFKDDKGKLDWSPKLFQMFAEIVKEKFKTQITHGGDWAKFPDYPHFELKDWQKMIK